MAMHTLGTALPAMTPALKRAKKSRRGADGLTDRERQKLVDQWASGPGSLATLDSDGALPKRAR